MAKRKVNFNTAVDRIKKAVHDYGDINLTDVQLEQILTIIESHRKTSGTQTIPPPPKDPPGGTNP